MTQFTTFPVQRSAFEVEARIRLHIEGDSITLPCAEATAASAQAALVSGAYGSASIAVQASVNGRHWHALGVPVALTADAIVTPIDVTGIRFIRAVVTTTSASPAEVLVTLFAQRE